eukprot:COSAG01_NODE_147_length_24095_cov_25.855428_5_plen_170_part_00
MPSPVISSCAVAVRAIIDAVGFWICWWGGSNSDSARASNSRISQQRSPPAHHFRQKRVAVLRQLDITRATHEPAQVSSALYARCLQPACRVEVGVRTYILRVPFGPRLVLTTSCRPFADAMFIARAWPRETISAFWLTLLMLDIAIALRSKGLFLSTLVALLVASAGAI